MAISCGLFVTGHDEPPESEGVVPARKKARILRQRIGEAEKSSALVGGDQPDRDSPAPPGIMAHDVGRRPDAAIAISGR